MLYLGCTGTLHCFCDFSVSWNLFQKKKKIKKRRKRTLSQGHSSWCLFEFKLRFAWFQSMLFLLCHAFLIHTAQTAVSELVKTGLGHPFQKNYFMGKTSGTIRHKPIFFKWGKWGTGLIKMYTENIYSQLRVLTAQIC